MENTDKIIICVLCEVLCGLCEDSRLLVHGWEAAFLVTLSAHTYPLELTINNEVSCVV